MGRFYEFLQRTTCLRGTFKIEKKVTWNKLDKIEIYFSAIVYAKKMYKIQVRFELKFAITSL